MLDADVAQAVLEITEGLGGETNGFHFLWKQHLFVEGFTSKPGPCAWGEGWTLEGKVICLLPGTLPGQHICESRLKEPLPLDLTHSSSHRGAHLPGHGFAFG